MGSKKITKVLSKFDLGHKVAKGLGLPDPSGDAIYGSNKTLSPAEQAQKNAMDMAKQQAEQADRQMQMQLDAANQSAAQGAITVQQQQDREVASQQAAEAGQIQQERPTVELADVATTSGTRKKYKGQIGGGASKGPSVRV
jgi:hypothetical protein